MIYYFVCFLLFTKAHFHFWTHNNITYAKCKPHPIDQSLLALFSAIIRMLPLSSLLPPPPLHYAPPPCTWLNTAPDNSIGNCVIVMYSTPTTSDCLITSNGICGKKHIHPHTHTCTCKRTRTCTYTCTCTCTYTTASFFKVELYVKRRIGAFV